MDKNKIWEELSENTEFPIVTKGQSVAQIDTSSEKLSEKKEITCEADVREVRLESGATGFIYYWTIDPTARNTLQKDGRDISVRSLFFDLDPIAWKAGGGWPTYRVPCPHPENGGSGFDYSGFKRHCIVATMGSGIIDLFEICSAGKQTISRNGRGKVTFEVNDNGASDNTGSFDVNMYGFKS